MPVLERSMIGLARNALFALVACLICFEPLAAQAPAVIDAAPASGARIEAVAARHGMVVAQEARAARIGVEILEQGGNAVDAAVATGFPGTVAGLALAHAKYGSGKFTLAQLIAPAIALASDGIPIENDIADSLPRSQSRLARWPATTKIFFADGRPLPPGATLLQRDLADTLTAIAREGPAGFYRGAVADKLVAAVRAAGGIMTREDLKNYQPIERTPTSGSYRGYRIVSMPPSSSGGVALVEMLNILEGYRLGEVDAATRIHLMVEAMKRAYFDRAKFLGDPASVTPPAYLTSKRFAESLRARIDPPRATAAASFGSIFAPAREGDNTTHFSVVDRFGNAVANTTTLNLNYGLGLVDEGNVIDRKLSIADAIAEPRIHHQWSPDEVVVERGFSPDLVGALKARGHDVVEGLPPTSANSILVTPAGLVGAADNRTR